MESENEQLHDLDFFLTSTGKTMTMNERLRLLIAEMLDLPKDEVTSETVRADTQTWDSLNHLQLVTAIESEFGATLTMEEIAGITTAGDLDRIVATRGRSESRESRSS